ncbi:hypothetical protein C7H85_11900 [Zobellella endophytica]|uniref:TNase-like domain-containing protein n=1 Tax=Zobellella endophytica TaxID=2116700 RepID=A0A2P7R554_9GAMM|nr:thermonuclease family protein [Zobellella endophytica]PSJ45349.1 hypothetical protein C7H85_11900 [Zobellella endophytica]
MRTGRVIFLCCLFLPFFAGAACPRLIPDETVSVRHVIDGDTVILDDGRVIRFIGIDTPEFNKHRKKAVEPGAEQARRWLLNKISEEIRLKLVFGIKRRDDYGRWLAHPLTASGHLLAEQMLSLGLGPLLMIPPNHRHWPCLFEAEQAAYRARRGIWQRPLPAAPSAGGWQALAGRITEVRRRGGDVQLMLEHRLRLHAGSRLPAAALDRLSALQPGQRLLVRGRVYRVRDAWRLRLDHPWQFAGEHKK